MRIVWSLLHTLRIPIDPAVWRRFVQIVRELWPSRSVPQARLLLWVLISFMLAINGLNVINSYVNRNFMTAIEHREMDTFLIYALLYLAVFALSTAVSVLYRYAESMLGLLWRKWLTTQSIERYFKDRTYFRVNARAELKNPDQRISEDIRSMTATTLSFLLMLLNAILTVIAFSGVLLSISPLLFAVAVSYSLLGSLIAIYLGKSLVKLDYDQLDMEAAFRTSLLRVRDNAESVALLRPEGRLKAGLYDRLKELVSNFQRIIKLNRNLGYFTSYYNYLIQIIPALIVAPLFIQGKMEFGVITQSAVAFGHLIGAFSLIVTQFQAISNYTAVVVRLKGLRDAMTRERPAHSPTVEVREGCGSVVYSGLTLYSQSKERTLLRELSLSIPAGVCLLVRSKSEAAEKALFRATADLWDHGEGHILQPGPDEIFFVPERPYIPPGTLREILLRTGEEGQVSDQRIVECLKSLNLEPALAKAGGLDSEQQWGDLLSLGEQQRLCFARVLLAEPRFVFLDHPGRGLCGCRIGELLALLSERGITYLTLGDASDDPCFYDRLLEIECDGSWRLSPPVGGEAMGNGIPPMFDGLEPARAESAPARAGSKS